MIRLIPSATPYLIRDIVLLEKIQRRATKFILADYVSDYKSRLVALGLLPLMAEMEIGDVMFYFRNLKTPGDHFNVNHFLQFSSKPTRSGSKGRLEQRRRRREILSSIGCQGCGTACLLRTSTCRSLYFQAQTAGSFCQQLHKELQPVNSMYFSSSLSVTIVHTHHTLQYLTNVFFNHACKAPSQPRLGVLQFLSPVILSNHCHHLILMPSK